MLTRTQVGPNRHGDHRFVRVVDLDQQHLAPGAPGGALGDADGQGVAGGGSTARNSDLETIAGELDPDDPEWPSLGVDRTTLRVCLRPGATVPKATSAGSTLKEG